MSDDTDDLGAFLVPLTEVEKAELLHACRGVLTPRGIWMLRRAFSEIDRLKADPRMKLPIVRRP